ncbi:ADP-ribosyltransferase, partial [Bacillus thuringiensis]|uniref:ADP-ribosyltransferase n=1 Tax=Bacillus thuringiensis TaxID=1428 RepID=UPI003D6C8CAE
MHYRNSTPSLTSKQFHPIHYYTPPPSSQIQKYLIQTHPPILHHPNLLIPKNINLITTPLNKNSIPQHITLYTPLSSIPSTHLTLLN